MVKYLQFRVGPLWPMKVPRALRDLAAEIAAWQEKYGSSLRSDVIKIAHHGSDYSSTDDFLRATSPSFAVISCGKNSYGHPSMRVITTLKTLGADVAITEGDGVVIYDIFPDRVERKK